MRRWLGPAVIGLATPPWLSPEWREAILALPQASIWLLLFATGLLARWRSLQPVVVFGAALVLSGYRVLLADSAQLRVSGNLRIDTELLVEQVRQHSGGQYASVTGRVMGARAGEPAPSPLPRGRRLRLFWPLGESRLPLPTAGSRWRIVGTVKAPVTARNPGGFQYDRWLRAHGVAALGSVASARPIGPIRPRSGEPGKHRSARGAIQARLAAVPDSGLLQAVLFGDFAALSEAKADLIRATGTVHLFVVSGLHIGLIGGFCGWLGGALGRVVLAYRRQGERHRWIVAGALAGASGFVWLTGGGVPATRALFMFAVAGLMLLRGRLSQAPAALGASLCLVLCLDPMAALLPGTWLSFVATGLLLGFWGHRLGRPGLVAGAVKTQLLLSIGSLLVLSLFNLPVSAWSGLYNLLLVPLLGAVWLPACCLSLAGAVLGLPGADASLGVCLWAGHGMLEALAMLHQSLPGSEPAVFAAGTGPAVWLRLLLAGSALVLLLRPVAPGRDLFLAAACVAALLVPSPRQALAPGAFALWVLDVGHGTAVLVETRSRKLLYDAGPRSASGRDAGKEVVVPALRQLGVQQLDALVISHDDLDHSGGEATVLQRLKPAAHWRRQASGSALTGRECHAGQHWRWDQVNFRFLHPAPQAQGARNEQSCVLLVSSSRSGKRALLTGDIGQASEYELLRKLSPGVDFLLVPHHGSAGSSGAAFVRWLHPLVAGLSVARNSRYGLPAPKAIARYRAAGAQLASTGILGAYGWQSHCPKTVSALGWDLGGPARQSPTEAWPPAPGALRRSESCPPRFLRRDAAAPRRADARESAAGGQKNE